MNAPSQHLQQAEAILAAIESPRVDDPPMTQESKTLNLAVANTHIALATAQLLARRCQA